MNKRYLFLLFFGLFLLSFFIQAMNEPKIDWINGKIYSSITIAVKNDDQFAHNRLHEIEKAKEKAKINYYRILKSLTLSESVSLLDHIQNVGDKNRYLFTLIDQAFLSKVEYPSLNQIKLTYFINLYGRENSLMSIIMDDANIYTEELTSYMGYNYDSDYSGLVIDARGQLTSFEGYPVKVNPAIFVTLKDTDGNIIFNKNNVYPEVIIDRGMVRYSYDIYENVTDRVGHNPLKIVAYGAGDRRGAIITVSLINAKRMLGSFSLRNAVKEGKIVIIIDN